jgi:hypothetical protein
VLQERSTNTSGGILRRRVIPQCVHPSLHIDYKNFDLKHFLRKAGDDGRVRTFRNPHDFGVTKVWPICHSYEGLAKKSILQPPSPHLDFVNGFNILAEIPGEKDPDDFVMLGCQLDSAAFASGATEDAAGCAIVLEAMRLVKALKIPISRSIRVALFTGEKQWFLGSKAYVQKHLNYELSLHLRVFVSVDWESGKIRGLVAPKSVHGPSRSKLASWLPGLYLPEAGNVVYRRPFYGTSDESSFTDAGLPGYAFLEEPLEFESEPDLKQAAVVAAYMAIAAANDKDF